MIWMERILILASILAGVAGFAYVLWTRRLAHVVPKVGEVRIVNPGGLFSGIFEVLTQKRVLANRPIVGFAHLFVFYGFVSFGLKSISHVAAGFGILLPLPGWYAAALDFFAIAVLAALAGLAYRRYFVDRQRLTHMLESGAVLSLIALLMVTHLLEHPFPATVEAGVLATTGAGRVNWWLHFLVLVTFPALIAYGKHLHLIMAPVNVVLRRMTEKPSDRKVFGEDFSLEAMEDEQKMEAEYARLGMPNGVADFSFHPLFDTAACIECGRCNDACPSRFAGLKPRDHFVLALRDPGTTAQELAELVPPEILATCTQCRACDKVCPVGNRPARAGLEMRGRLAFEGLYPIRPLKEAAGVTAGTGNIFGEPEDTRQKFVEANGFPIFEPGTHDVLFVLGCQGGNSPEVQPVVVATGKLLDAAGVKWGILAEEKCWGEGILQSSDLMDTWPMWWQERIDALDAALGGKRETKILTICPHCRDTIAVQYRELGAHYPDVVLHLSYLEELTQSGRLRFDSRTETMAAHHPCKVIHNHEDGDMDGLLAAAGVSTKTAEKSPSIPRCCGGGGGGFLWDSPARVNRNRFDALRETGERTIVTGCPGCHRMLNVAKDEETKITDVATVLAERLSS